MADTVTSIRWPGLAKAGRSAVMITAAAFFSAGRLTPGGNCTPMRAGNAVHRLRQVFEVVVAGARQAHDHAVAGQLVAERTP
jgi:hypothetical protein